MSAMRLYSQKELDSLLAEYGVTPMNKKSSDETQQLYKASDEKHFMLPFSTEGYGDYMVDDIIAHVKKMACSSEIIEKKTYHAKPSLKIAKKDD